MAILTMQAGQFRQSLAASETVLVEFYAPWCAYCRRIEAAAERVAEKGGRAYYV